jgi:hypothetical protein
MDIRRNFKIMINVLNVLNNQFFIKTNKAATAPILILVDT